MKKCQISHTILMADDDAEECLLVDEALKEAGTCYQLRIVHDGDELLSYLRHCGEYEGGRGAPRPDLILLDLKMPRRDGHEVIQELKNDSCLRQIPVVAFTTSTTSDDVEMVYSLGANSYVAKPSTFGDLVETVKILCQYWFNVVELPGQACSSR